MSETLGRAQKLTRAQKGLLRDVASGSTLALSKGDETMLKTLARKGLCSRHVDTFGNINMRHTWVATAAGRAALKQEAP